MLTLEHIDPRQHPLVSGLQNDFNEVIAEGSYNFSKAQLFVPYRITTLSPHINPGDLGEFLIRGEWTKTEFMGEWWKMEANSILAFHSARGGPKRVNWEERIKEQEEKWSCHILVCSPDGRLTKNSLATKKCPHKTSEPKPLWFLTKPRAYCCRTHQNRTYNEQRKHRFS